MELLDKTGLDKYLFKARELIVFTFPEKKEIL